MWNVFIHNTPPRRKHCTACARPRRTGWLGSLWNISVPPDVPVIPSEEAAALNSSSQVYIEKLDFEKDCKKLTPDFASLANKVTIPINFTMIKIGIYALKEISRNINSLNKLLSRNVLYKTLIATAIYRVCLK